VFEVSGMGGIYSYLQSARLINSRRSPNDEQEPMPDRSFNVLHQLRPPHGFAAAGRTGRPTVDVPA
jgi:hypothetical protein